MKKFAEEVVKYFWIPLIMGLVSYIFFQLKDVLLGIITLVGLSAVYSLVRLYFTYKKWWLVVILVVVVFSTGGAYFLKAPTIGLTVNGERVTSAEINIAGGSVLVSPEPVNGLFAKGTLVTLTASAGQGQDWVSWTGTDNDNINPTTVKMDNSRQVRVNFESRFSLIINNEMVIGSYLSFPEGSVTISPPPESDGKYTSGTVVNLSVKTNPGYDWKSWTGTGSDNTNPTTVVMSKSNKNVAINFEGRFPLMVSNQLVIGPVIQLPEGSVTVEPPPGPDDKYAYGTKVTLTANPDTGYGWKSWAGTGNDISNPAAITITSEKHVTVSFEPRYMVMINNRAMNGAAIDFAGGKITADPAPGTDARFTRDSLTTLTAVPLPGYRFGGWGGDVSAKVTSVSLLMDNNKNITASFVKVYNLAITVNNEDGGSVSPGNGTYDEGSYITLTANPAPGYRFDKWGGDVSGNYTSASVLFDADKAVTADFVKVYTLTVSVTPAEGGTVTPGNGTYDSGSEVILTAIPSAGYRFDGWEGDLSGFEASANVTMDTDRTVTARFVPE